MGQDLIDANLLDSNDLNYAIGISLEGKSIYSRMTSLWVILWHYSLCLADGDFAYHLPPMEKIDFKKIDSIESKIKKSNQNDFESDLNSSYEHISFFKVQKLLPEIRKIPEKPEPTEFTKQLFGLK